MTGVGGVSLEPCQKLVVDGRVGKSRKNVEVTLVITLPYPSSPATGQLCNWSSLNLLLSTLPYPSSPSVEMALVVLRVKHNLI